MNTQAIEPIEPDVQLDLQREAARDLVEVEVLVEYDAARRWEAST